MIKIEETTTSSLGTGDYIPKLKLKKNKLIYCEKCGGIFINRCLNCQPKDT